MEVVSLTIGGKPLRVIQTATLKPIFHCNAKLLLLGLALVYNLSASKNARNDLR